MTLLRPLANQKIDQTAPVEEPVRGEIRGILSQFMQLPDNLQLQHLAIGGQARLYIARRADWRPVWSGHPEIVVKIFDPGAPGLAQTVETAFRSFGELARVIDSSRVNGWTVKSPQPLHLSRAPYALVTTLVPGSPLASRIEQHAECDSVAAKVAQVLLRFWRETGLLYGDLTLHNILVDELGRCLSFVDCGAPDSTWECTDVPRHWYPASRDLAYLLFSVASAVRVHMGRPSLRARHIAAAERMVGLCVDGLATAATKDSLIGEIRACAMSHIRTISCSATPGGIWRSIVRRQALRAIVRMTSNLQRERPIAHLALETAS